MKLALVGKKESRGRQADVERGKRRNGFRKGRGKRGRGKKEG